MHHHASKCACLVPVLRAYSSTGHKNVECTAVWAYPVYLLYVMCMVIDRKVCCWCTNSRHGLSDATMMMLCGQRQVPTIILDCFDG